MMRFSIDLLEFLKVFFTIQNSGAFDQDVIASPVRALAQIGTALVGFRLNLIAYLSRANKRESFRMGSSSNEEPMREGSM